MIQSKPENKKLIVGAFIVATLCTQLFSIVHFHHDHDGEDNLTFIVSAHPLNTENNSHNHHDNDDHHHTRDGHIIGEWHFIKSVSNSPNKILSNDGLFAYKIFNESIHLSTFFVIDSNHHPPPSEFLYSQDSSRGPPASLS